MSRLFEAALQAASYAKFRPQPPPTTIAQVINYVKGGSLVKPELAVDVGCGSGQCTSLLADHFLSVLGFDISANQIKHAKQGNQHNNVTYDIALGDKLPVADASADLITCAQSFHWLNTDTFYPEVNRILKPNGVVALITYEMPFLHLSKSHPLQHGKTECNRVRQLIRNFYSHSILKPFWASKERYLVDTAYRTVVLPFPNQMRFEDRLINDNISASDILGYIHSWSGFNSLKKANEEAADRFIAEFNETVAEISGNSDSKCFSVEFPFTILMARKC